MPSAINAELVQLSRLARESGLEGAQASAQMSLQVALRVKTDLLLALPSPPPDDLAAYAAFAAAVIPAADEPSLLVLACKLAGWKPTPAPVLAALKARGGLVLAALLRHGLPAAADEIEELAEHGETAVAEALSVRDDLTPAAAILLAARAAATVDLALAANPQAPLPRAALDPLLARARSAPVLARALLSRADLRDSDLAPLYLQAGPERRIAILETLRALDALAPVERRPSLPQDQFTLLLSAAGEEAPAMTQALALHLNAPQALSDALLADASRELLALALTAAGVSAEDATRLLIRLGDETAHSVPRIFALVALMRSLTPSLAARLLAAAADVTFRPAPRAKAHQPAMAAGGTGSRAGAAAETRQPATDLLRKLGLRRDRA